MQAKRHNERYVLMIYKYYYSKDCDELCNCFYSDDLIELRIKQKQLWEQDKGINDNLVYFFNYAICDNKCKKYII